MSIRSLITGGTGFVGQHLASFLHSRGSRVAILAPKAQGSLESADSSTHFYEADIRDAAAVRAATHDFKPDHIYHLAAVSSVDTSQQSPRFTYDVNVFGTLNVLEAALTCSRQPRVLLVSTAQVYAPGASALTESSPLAPQNPYAASKSMAELLRVHYKGGILIARSFNHSGPGQSSAFVLSSIARQFVEIELGLREPRLSLGNTQVKRDFTDVRDVVRAYSSLLEKSRPNEIYNVCSGRTWSVQQIVEEFQSISGIAVRIQTDAAKVRPGEVSEVCGSFQKLHAATGWEPEISLPTTLRDLLSYWRAELAGTDRQASRISSVPATSSPGHLVSK
ncbi:MAG TPA: GDP-mannose 4,6-dehydratase [Terriglobales bacterium]|nr:GDP-mannose 4,6-dehydratase [Terriglobales bacterium]